MLLQSTITKSFRYLKMEVLNLISGHFGGGVFLKKPYPYSLYRFKYLHFRYLKCSIPPPTKNRWWFPAINRLIQKKSCPQWSRAKWASCDECHFFVGVVCISKKHVTLKRAQNDAVLHDGFFVGSHYGSMGQKWYIFIICIYIYIYI